MTAEYLDSLSSIPSSCKQLEMRQDVRWEATLLRVPDPRNAQILCVDELNY